MRARNQEHGLGAAAPFILEGLARGDRCTYLAERPDDPLLRARLPPPSDRFEILGTRQVGLQGGALTPDAMLQWIGARCDASVAAGANGYHFVGEILSVVLSGMGAERFPGFESRLGALIGGRPLAALCIYDGQRAPAALVREMLSTHTEVLVGPARCQNPHFVPPSSYLAPDRPRGEVDEFLAALLFAHRQAVGRLDHDEQVRRAVSRELHDDVGQLLVSLRLSLASDPALAGALADEALEAVRTLARKLRPSLLDDLGLVPALRSLLRLAQTSGLEIRLELGTLDRAPLDRELATAAYRLVQQAVTNVVDHAQARHLEVSLTLDTASLQLVVRDDGVGFEVSARRGGIGLDTMAERAALAGGELRVESQPGQGTTVWARLPLGPWGPP